VTYPPDPQHDPTSSNPYQAYQPTSPPPYPPAPPQYQPGPQYQPAPPSPPPSGGTNGFAIASLIFGIIGGVLLSVIFGIVALSQVKRRNQRGKGLAVAGLVLSGIWLLVIVVGVGVALVAASRDAGGPGSALRPSHSSTRDNLAVGDCINGLLNLNLDQDLQRTPPTVACTEPHEGEVYHVITLTDAAFPGDATIQKKAEDGCADALPGYAPNEKTKDLEVYYLYPTSHSWIRGDRDITCLAVSEGTKLTGSLRD
jgi:Domain of unknown function (DUF4190)/Septum formation